jgi:hypothetical protein
MKPKSLAVFLYALFFSASFAFATDRYYPDISVESADGNYKLAAVSPENAEFDRPFASNFVYTLTDASSGETIWTRNQDEREGSPIRAFVSERGTCVIWTGWEQLAVLSAATGEVIHTHRILDQVRQADMEMHVSMTTAGPMWAEFSHWYFLKIGESEHFVLRPAWGHRQIIDIGRRNLIVEDVPPPTLEACLTREREFALSTLRQATERAKTDPLTIDQHAAITAMVIAAQNGIKEALPQIRALEKVKFVQLWDGEYVAEAYDSTNHRLHLEGFHAASSFEFRLASQFAIRIFGERPAGLPSSVLLYRTPDWELRVVDLAQPEARDERASAVTSLRGAAEVLELLGPPDSLNYNFGRRWEYHYWDGTAHVTLSLSFDHRQEDIEIEQIRPAIWLHKSEWIERLKL